MSIHKIFILSLFPIYLFAESNDSTKFKVSWVGIEFRESPETTRKTIFSVPYGSTDYVGDSKIVINDDGEMVFFNKDSDNSKDSQGMLLEDEFDFSIVNNLEIPEEEEIVIDLLENAIVDQVVEILPPIMVPPIYTNFNTLSGQINPVYLSSNYLIINGVKLKELDEFIISGYSYDFLSDYGEELNLFIDGTENGISDLLGTEILLTVTEEILKLYPNVSGLSLGRQISVTLSEDVMDVVVKYLGLNDGYTAYNFDIYSLNGSLLGNTSIDFPDKISLVRVKSPIKSLASRTPKTKGFDGADRFRF